MSMSEGRLTLFVTRPLSGRAKRRRQRRRGERSEAKAVQVCTAKAGKKSRQDGTESCSSRAGGGGEDHRNGSDNYLRGRRAAIFSLNKHQAFPLEGARDSAPSVPVARGRRPEESCIARAPVCPSVRPAYRGVRACRHFVQVLHQRLRAASTHVLRFVRAESFARGPAPHCGADFSKRMTRRAFALGPFLPGGCHLVALFHSYGSGREPELHL